MQIGMDSSTIGGSPPMGVPATLRAARFGGPAEAAGA